jgi:hypothetical protein
MRLRAVQIRGSGRSKAGADCTSGRYTVAGSLAIRGTHNSVAPWGVGDKSGYADNVTFHSNSGALTGTLGIAFFQRYQGKNHDRDQRELRRCLPALPQREEVTIATSLNRQSVQPPTRRGRRTTQEGLEPGDR